MNGKIKKKLKPFEKYLASVTPFLEAYEKEEFAIGAASAEEVLKFLMEQNDLSLSKRFKVHPATFFKSA